MSAIRGAGGTCFVISSLRAGGAERCIARLAAHRASIERSVLVTIDSTDSDFYELAPRVERRSLGLSSSSPNLAAGLIANVTRARALRGAVRQSECDLVVSFVDITNVLTLAACVGRGVPVVVAERINPNCEQIAWHWNVLRRALYPRARAVVTQTRDAAEWASRFVRADRTFVIPNGVERHARTSPLGERGRVVLAVGRLVRQKRFDLAIEAFANAAGVHRDWTLIILGEGPERENLERLADSRGIGDRLHMPGVVRDVGRYLAGASVFVMTSACEGFPNALLEAMASGTAVVAMGGRTGADDIVRIGIDGIVIPPGDVAALTSALDSLMSQPALRSRLGDVACEVSNRFSTEAEFAAWDHLLEGLRRQ